MFFFLSYCEYTSNFSLKLFVKSETTLKNVNIWRRCHILVDIKIANHNLQINKVYKQQTTKSSIYGKNTIQFFKTQKSITVKQLHVRIN